MRRVDVPVLVVGAGPVGITAALLLAKHGVATRIVDRRPGPHRAPQAHVVNPRSLEIFRQLGIDTTRLRRMATPREDGGHVSFVTSLAGTEIGRLPYERQDDDVLASTPEPIINLSQHVLEPVLLEDVGAAPLVGAAWRQEWLSLVENEDGVTSTVRDLAMGDTYEIRSRWVLAADGAGSRVRAHLGIPMAGPERLQSFVMIHFEGNLRPLVRDRPAIIYWTLDPDHVGTFVAHDIDRTWVFMHPFDPDTDPASSYDESRCTEIVRGAMGRRDVDVTVRTISPWHMTSQVAERYRAGRVFLIGDSAHRFPPAGGMGMNTGIQDAHNLVWKLRLVDDGRAGAGLLDTYEVERRPIARRNADQSLVNAVRMIEMFAELGIGVDATASRANLDGLLGNAEGRAKVARAIEAQRDHFDMLGLQLGISYDAGAIVPDGTTAPVPANPVRHFEPSAHPGSRLPHGWIERDGTRQSSLDLVAGDRFTLITGPSGASWAAATEGIAATPIIPLVAGRDFTDPAGAWLGACGVGPTGALLVRPDQHVAWRAPTGDPNPGQILATVLGTIL